MARAAQRSTRVVGPSMYQPMLTRRMPKRAHPRSASIAKLRSLGPQGEAGNEATPWSVYAHETFMRAPMSPFRAPQFLHRLANSEMQFAIGPATHTARCFPYHVTAAKNRIGSPVTVFSETRPSPAAHSLRIEPVQSRSNIRSRHHSRRHRHYARLTLASRGRREEHRQADGGTEALPQQQRQTRT
jgi:hypothetical protein